MWQQHGQYDAMHDKDQFYIYPTDKHGKTRRVAVVRYSFFLRHRPTGEVVEFRRYLHQKRWFWGDSRAKGPVSADYVQCEVARMMFGGDAGRAADWLIAGLVAA